MAFINVTRTITECHEVTKDAKARKTIGQQIDSLLFIAANEGHIIQTVTLELAPEEWHSMAHDLSDPKRGDIAESKKVY